MNKEVALAVSKKASGEYNCAQAVACAYCDYIGMEEQIVKSLMKGYGGGMGCMEGTCGAISGAAIIVSAASSSNAEAMSKMKVIMNGFKQKNGSTICKELKGIGTGKVLRDCSGCVQDAASLLSEVLNNELK